MGRYFTSFTVPLLVGLFFYDAADSRWSSRVIQFGESRAKLHTDEKKVTFADVAGVDEVKEDWKKWWNFEDAAEIQPVRG